MNTMATRSAFLAVVLAAVAHPVLAQTITFDDLAPCGSDIAIPNGYSSFTWQNFFCHDAVLFPAGGYFAGNVSYPNVAFNGGGDEASIVGASPFAFGSAYFTAAWNDNLLLTVTGSLGVNQLFTQSVFLSATAPLLVTFNWQGIDKLTFVSAGGTQHPGYDGIGTQFVMDDMTTDLTATPEPVSSLLVATGLGAVAFIRRRRRLVSK